MNPIHNATSPPTAVESLLEGALDVFTKHGFAKASMSDIADAASISRTSLYKYFPTKQDVFKALSEKMNHRVYDQVVAALDSADDPCEQLLAVVNARVGWVYDLLHRSEFGRELISEKNRVCGHQVLAANDRFARLVKRLLSKRFPDVSRAHLIKTTRVLLAAINGILENADTSSQAKSDVELLIRAYLQGFEVRYHSGSA